MKTPSLEKRLRAYFTTTRLVGICGFVANGNDQGDYDPYHKNVQKLRQIAEKWPYSIKSEFGISSYFIPSKIGNSSWQDAHASYFLHKVKKDFHTCPARLEFVNFALKQIAREKKKKFVPIKI